MGQNTIKKTKRKIRIKLSTGRGDIVELNKVICGDCISVMRDMEDNSVDLVLTDIPYDMVNRKSQGLRNLDKADADIANFSLQELLIEIMRLAKGSIYMFCGFGQISEIALTFKNNKINPRLIIWEKTNPSPMNGDVTWLSGIEPCIFAKFPNATFNGHCNNTVLRYPISRNKTEHPTEKNLDLFKHLVNISSKEKDIILDPFLGSGTTAVAAKELHRNYIGIEISEKYCAIAKNRLRQGVLNI